MDGALDEDEKGTADHMVAGLLAGISADAVTHPLDTVRARLQVQRLGVAGNYLSTGDALRRILREEGVRSLYRGFGAVAFFTGPAHALYFSTYEAMKTRIAAMAARDGVPAPTFVCSVRVSQFFFFFFFFFFFLILYFFFSILR
jgi:hypothetical protein